MSHWPRLTVTEVDNSVYDWTCVLEMATGRHESNGPDNLLVYLCIVFYVVCIRNT